LAKKDDIPGVWCSAEDDAGRQRQGCDAKFYERIAEDTMDQSERREPLEQLDVLLRLLSGKLAATQPTTESAEPQRWADEI
jgi:hypothetical protein